METAKLSWDDCIYTSCYCEENVWKLCETFRDRFKMDLSHFHVVFISNATKQIQLWCQRASKDPLFPVIWDYHVILVYEKGRDTLVYDFDTILDFPCQLQQYAEKALQSEDDFKGNSRRMFRVIPASCYLQTFASDRSHMLNKDGKWLKPPPGYSPIKTQDCTMNLFEYIDMNPTKGRGTVFNLNNFLEHFHCDVDYL